MSILPEYAQLIGAFYKVVDSKRGDELPDGGKWLFDAETLSVKLFNHLGTILYLSSGTHLPEINSCLHRYIDHSSISVLTRASFETYLTFYFIYCDGNCGIEEHKFRHSLWKFSALIDRQKFKVVSKINTPILALEKQAIDKWLAEIESNKLFLNLDNKLQKKAKRGEWRLNKSWADLAEIAGFDKEIFRNVYSYLCSYAHAGGLSGLQIGQAISLDDQQSLTTISTHFGLLLMSHFLFSYTSLFPETEINLTKNNEIHRLAEKWSITWKEKDFKSGFIS